MTDYPAQLVRQHELRDGRTVTIRPFKKEDAALEREFLLAFSEQGRYMRFMSASRDPEKTELRFLTDVDFDRKMAFVCTVPRDGGEKLIGDARYVVLPGDQDCEFAIVIADAWHKSGIAGLLMDALIKAARARGLNMMTGFVLPRNRDMLRFTRALGFKPVSASLGSTLTEVGKPLQPPKLSRVR